MAAIVSYAAFAAKTPDGKGSAGDADGNLLHDGVVTVLPFGLDQLEREIGEHDVVAPGREQLVLPGRCPLFRSRTGGR